MRIIPPDIAQADRHGGVHRPSWSGASPVAGAFINAQHREVFEATKSLPGWQDPPDSHKLYETAYFNGSVILEIGVYGGRSAVVALRGAAAAARDRGLPAPQFYGIDIDGAAIGRGFTTIRDAGLEASALLFHGDLTRFVSELPITPSMVFVDGDHAYPGCWNDLRLLASRLAPGTPVVCHDYGWLAGVRRAVDEAIRAGCYEKMGQFCTSVLLRTTDVRVPGRPSTPRGLTTAMFQSVRASLLRRYFSDAAPRLRADKTYTPVRDLTASARAELSGFRPVAPASGSWPHENAIRSPFDSDSSLPPLTVITPTLNCEAAIEETMLSIARQHYPGIQHIVVDRGSTDRTVEIANSIGGAVVLAERGDEQVRAERYPGRIRRAIAAATGRRMIWVEGGETLAPNSLLAIGRALAEERSAASRIPIEHLLEHGSAYLGGRTFHRDDFAGRRTPVAPNEVYDIAYHHGRVMLAVGLLGGRSGLIELRGAMAGAKDRGLPPPQFYGLDADQGAVLRSRSAMERAGLLDHALLFAGDLRSFLRELPIAPTLVLLDGLYPGDKGYHLLRSRLEELREALSPGTPLIARQYFRSKTVHRAIDEALSEGSFNRIGLHGGILFTSAGPRPGSRVPLFLGRGLSSPQFESTRQGLMGSLIGTPPALGGELITAAARRELEGDRPDRSVSGRGPWPFSASPVRLPPTLPGGRPWPRISIVTPSFNQGKYIEETILSVRNQGYPNVEHIIMDGGSTDNTLGIIDKYRDGFAHATSAKDKGQSDAISRGFKLATGDILTWLNSDDMLTEGALAAVAMAFAQSGADMVAGECHIHRDGKVEARHLTACDHGPLPLQDLFDVEGCWLEGQFFYQPEVMFTRAIWERAGAHVREDLYHSMDYELWLRMAQAGAKLQVIGRPVALFRAHDEQKTAGNVVGGFRVELPKARDAFIAERGLVWSGQKQPARRGPMRIVLVNDLGFAYGADIAHRRMAEALNHAGHEVFAVAASLTDYHSSAPRATHEGTVQKIATYQPDLVIIGNMHGAGLDPALLGAIAQRFRTVFVMHDQWLLTGRCAYSGECKKYLSRCDSGCTCAKVHPTLDGHLIGPAWDSKRRVLGACPDLAIWTNSDWLNARVEEALDGPGRLAGPRPRPIKFGFELETFRPRDRRVCRELLGLPQDKFIVMSSASSVSDPRKGLAHLADALGILRLPDVQVVCVGWFGDREEPPIPGMRAMGYMKDPRRLAKLYAAADIFVGPSLEEAFGQVFVEAAACGTPCVGYPVGGVPEAIRHGVSGLIASKVEPAALAAAIGDLYRDRALRESLGQWGRLWVENDWSMSASYHRMFQAIAGNGWSDSLGTGRRLNLVVRPRPAPEVSVIGPTLPGWRAVSGFDSWEGPYPDRGIGRCRWALGPTAVFEVDSEVPDHAQVLLSCRCFHPGQRVRIIHAGTDLGDRAVENAAESDRVLTFEVSLKRGPNRFELHFWKWATGGERPMAVLVTDITVIPRTTAVMSELEVKPAGVPVS